MSSITNFLNSYGTISPIAAIALFIIIPSLPIFLFFLPRRLICSSTTANSSVFHDIKKDIFSSIVKYPIIFTIFNTILLIFLCLNQVAYCYQQGFTVAFSVDYYLGVNSVQYNDYSAITNAQTNSGVGVKSLSSTRRKLGSSSEISIIYHTSGYDNLLSSGSNYQLLVDVCATEAAIKNIPCIQNGNQLFSIIPQLFSDSSCSASSINSPAQLEIAYNDKNNAYYLQQSLNTYDTSSAVILSFFYASECTVENFQDFQNSLYATTVGPIEVVFINNELSSQEFLVDIYNSLYVTEIAIIGSVVVLVIGLRGLICAIATFFCIAGSMIAALGVLPVAKYSEFSAFNVVSIYILIGVGATTVLIFGSAWRTVFLKASSHGKSIFSMAFYCGFSTFEDEEINADGVEQAYTMMGYPALFTALATYLSLYSKLASPVIVISQLGLYMGTCYIIFYALFHYIIISVWIFTSKVYLFRKHQPVDDRMPDGLSDAECGAMTHSHGNFEMPRATNTNSCSTPEWQLLSPTSTSSREQPPLFVPPPPFPVYHATSVSQSDAFDSDTIIISDEYISPDHSMYFGSDFNNGSDTDSYKRNALATFSKKDQLSGRMELEDMNEIFCLSRVPYAVRGIGWVALILAIVICLAVYGTALKSDLVIDFSIPQLFASTTNLGQALYIEKNYYPDVLTATAPNSGGGSTIRNPTLAPTIFTPRKPSRPTLAPTIGPSTRPVVSTRVPSARPTVIPTAIPTNRPTKFPTLSPLAISSVPTIKSVPTIVNTVAPLVQAPTLPPLSVQPSTSVAPTSVHTDYVVEGSYGIYQNQQYIDQSATATWQWSTFMPYVSNGGLMVDMNNVCNYVDANKATLDVKSGWNKLRDCAYSQITIANQTLQAEFKLSPSAVISFAEQAWGTTYGSNLQFINQFWSELVLLFWAESTQQPNNLGVDFAYPIFEGSQVTTGVLMPVWIITNFSVSNPVSSLTTNLPTAFNMISVWDTAIAGQSHEATNDNIQIIVASSAFQFPILAQEVLLSIEFALIVSVVGFIFLIFLFTWNLSLTILGTICMFSVLVITLGLKLTIFNPVFDLLDVACIVAVIGMLVDFPIHLMLHLFHTTDCLQYTTWLALRVQRVAAYDNQGLAESVYISTRYAVFALFFPLVIILASSTPLLPAYITLIAKIGEYILLLVIASFSFTLLLFSSMLFLSIRLPTDQLLKKYVSKVEPETTERDNHIVINDGEDTRLAVSNDNNDCVDDDVDEEKYEEEKYEDRRAISRTNSSARGIEEKKSNDNKNNNSYQGYYDTTTTNNNNNNNDDDEDSHDYYQQQQYSDAPTLHPTQVTDDNDDENSNIMGINNNRPGYEFQTSLAHYTNLNIEEENL